MILLSSEWCEEPVRDPLACPLCDARPAEGHWSGCPLAPASANADTDPDANLSF